MTYKRGKDKLGVGTATTCERAGSWQNDTMVRNFTNVGIIGIIFFFNQAVIKPSDVMLSSDEHSS